MSTRLGVDVGGTFTDLIFFDEETGETRVGKVPTSPGEPERGILDAITAGVPEGRLRGRSTSCTARRSASTRCSSAAAPWSAC